MVRKIIKETEEGKIKWEREGKYFSDYFADYTDKLGLLIFARDTNGGDYYALYILEKASNPNFPNPPHEGSGVIITDYRMFKPKSIRLLKRFFEKVAGEFRKEHSKKEGKSKKLIEQNIFKKILKGSY